MGGIGSMPKAASMAHIDLLKAQRRKNESNIRSFDAGGRMSQGSNGGNGGKGGFGGELGWAQRGEKQSMERLLSWKSLHHAVGEMSVEPKTVTVPSNLDDYYTHLEEADDEDGDGIFF